MCQQFKYFAFISYNSNDIAWGKRLQRKLESYRMSATLCSERGWKRKPINPIFFAPTDIQPPSLTPVNAIISSFFASVKKKLNISTTQVEHKIYISLSQMANHTAETLTPSASILLFKTWVYQRYQERISTRKYSVGHGSTKSVHMFSWYPNCSMQNLIQYGNAINVN